MARPSGARKSGAQPSGGADSLDAFTFEIVKHRLRALTEEQGITLKAVSGSPIVTEACDFNTGIYPADGSIVTIGMQVIMQAGSMALVIRSVIDDCSENPGIEPGDMFILHDPAKGALHPPDVSIVAPVFIDDRLIAWVGTCAHVLLDGPAIIEFSGTTGLVRHKQHASVDGYRNIHITPS